MKSYSYLEKPIKVFGVPLFQDGSPRRLTDEVREQVPSLAGLGLRCPGARVCFRTDSEYVTVKITLKTFSVDRGMAIYAAQSAHVLIGDRKNPHFAGIVTPDSYENKEFEKCFKKQPVMEDVTVFLPRNEQIAAVEIRIDDDANILEPTPYYGKPILYYGSSITEGGCCCNPFNAYNAVISNHLNVDYYNFGFSGSARGELPLADYIATFDISLFVYDYDHNANEPEDLEATHEKFFKRLRELKPDLPVLMLSMPKEKYGEWNKKRRDIIKRTYENAINSGDKNVYFIDGETYFEGYEGYRCFLDTTHPNDFGFDLMARRIEPVIKQILSNN